VHFYSSKVTAGSGKKGADIGVDKGIDICASIVLDLAAQGYNLDQIKEILKDKDSIVSRANLPR